MIRVYWHMAGRFYRARSIRAFCNHLNFDAKSRKYFSMVENFPYEEQGDDGPDYARLPSGWWLIPSIILGATMTVSAVVLLIAAFQ